MYTPEIIYAFRWLDCWWHKNIKGHSVTDYQSGDDVIDGRWESHSTCISCKARGRKQVWWWQ